jgi:alkanesulfonate monooxygenase SsuD/methylene tetrahydromethanopterin reductase-like flavin-dependent oxidoreductase (luciferase family)
MRPLLGAYRAAWKEAGHEGEGEIMLAFHMFCAEDGDKARELASPLLDSYLRSLVDAAGDWLDGRVSADYPGYGRMIAKLREASAADLIANGAAWVGTPDEIAAQIARTREEFGPYEHASVQVNFNMMPLDHARASLRLFALRVMPRFTAPG